MLLFVTARLTFARGTLALPFVFAFRFTVVVVRSTLLFAGRFVLPFALALAFALSFVFRLRGRFGLFSFAFVLALVLRFALVVSSSGVTVSDDSPALVGRLMSIATV